MSILPNTTASAQSHTSRLASPKKAGLVAIGKPRMEPVLAALPSLKPVALMHALRTEGALVAADTTPGDTALRARCRSDFLPYVNRPDNFVRIQAIAACGTVLDDSLRAALGAKRAQEKDWFVLSKYHEVLDTK